MKKIILFSLTVLILFPLNACSIRTILIPPFPVLEIPLSGKSVVNCGTTDHSILLASYNIDQNKMVVEKDVDIMEYNLRDHQYQLVSLIKNTRINYIDFYEFLKPFIYTAPSGNKIYFRHQWKGTTYRITRTESDQEAVIFERKSLSKTHLIDFVLADSNKKNTYQYEFLSGNQFDSKTFEVFHYDIQAASIIKIAEGTGNLYSVPYYETSSYFYFEVKQDNKKNSAFCFRKTDNLLEKIIPLGEERLVGYDYDSDIVVSYNKSKFTFTLLKGSELQEKVKCSPFTHTIDRAIIKASQGSIYLLVILQDTFDSEKRMLRWIEYNPILKKVKEVNWNDDFQYRLDRGSYYSSKYDYYILAYQKNSREVVFGIINLLKGTIYFRKTDHRILPGHDFKSSFFIQDNYCFWLEGTTISEESVTGEFQTYNPMAYYCSLEEPLFQKINR